MFFVKIERDFFSPINPAENVIFLNDEEIYVEYLICLKDDGIEEYDLKKEIIKFK